MSHVTNDISYLSIQQIAGNVYPSGFWIQNQTAEIRREHVSRNQMSHMISIHTRWTTWPQISGKSSIKFFSKKIDAQSIWGRCSATWGKIHWYKIVLVWEQKILVWRDDYRSTCGIVNSLNFQSQSCPLRRHTHGWRHQVVAWPLRPWGTGVANLAATLTRCCCAVHGVTLACSCSLWSRPRKMSISSQGWPCWFSGRWSGWWACWRACCGRSIGVVGILVLPCCGRSLDLAGNLHGDLVWKIK